MKKLIFLFIALAAMSFVSCGTASKDTTAAQDTDSTVIDSVAADSTDSVLAVALTDSVSVDETCTD